MKHLFNLNNMIKLHNCDNAELMKSIKDETIDVICIDPPYLYLKNQKLERDFDEQLFFSECKRVLTKNGFIVMFGRGVSLARWTVILDELDIKFKEEIIWDKRRITSPVTPLGRRHETIHVFSKNGTVNRVKVDVFEKYKFEPEKLDRIVERLQTTLGNRKSFDLLRKYYKEGHKDYQVTPESKYNVTRAKNSNLNQNRTVVFGIGLEEGVTEQSIIHCVSDHFNTIHPTQKPVRLIERLLALVIPKDKEPKDIVVADFFGGSFSTMEAVYNMGMQGIACEIDKEYFELGKERIERLSKQTKLF